MDTDETYTFEDRTYVSPTLSRDEQEAFIDNLRSAQSSAAQSIDTQTHNLGTDIVHNQGGLLVGTDPNSYWMSRYQTPQINSKVSALRSAAQASALNQVLQNEQSAWENRYNQAYQDLQKRQYDYYRRQYDNNKKAAAKAASANTSSTSSTSRYLPIDTIDTTSQIVAPQPTEEAVSASASSDGSKGGFYGHGITVLSPEPGNYQLLDSSTKQTIWSGSNLDDMTSGTYTDYALEIAKNAGASEDTLYTMRTGRNKQEDTAKTIVDTASILFPGLAFARGIGGLLTGGLTQTNG